MLPKRRERVRSGIERAHQREFPRHRRFVRSHECCIAGKGNHICYGVSEFAHVRSSLDAGLSQKPADWWGISLCSHAHWMQHNMGEAEFERTYGINMKKLALEFARRSPDTAMKDVMRELGLL